MLRRSLARALLGGALFLSAAAVFVPSDAAASVSIAVPFDNLVKDADAVAVIIPGEHHSVWEDGRIATYTKVKVEQGVAGDLGPGSEGYIRTLGGVVGKIGQLVDGEPVFVKEKPSLLFMRKFKAADIFEVSARAQGQYPIVVDEKTKAARVIRSSSVGMLLPPKTVMPVQAGPVAPQSQGAKMSELAKPPRLAQEVLSERPLDDVTREVASAWKRLHASK